MHRQQIEIQDTWVDLATRLEGGRRDRVEARWNFEAMPIATANTIRQSFVGKATLDPYATDAEAAEMAAGRAAIGELLNLTNGYSLDTEFVVKAAPTNPRDVLRHHVSGVERGEAAANDMAAWMDAADAIEAYVAGHGPHPNGGPAHMTPPHDAADAALRRAVAKGQPV